MGCKDYITGSDENLHATTTHRYAMLIGHLHVGILRWFIHIHMHYLHMYKYIYVCIYIYLYVCIKKMCVYIYTCVYK